MPNKYPDRKMIVLFATSVVLLLCCQPQHPWVIYNHTPSVPVGWYVRQNKCIERGDLIAFRLPDVAHVYARTRGERDNLLVLKPVVAMAGDHVSTRHGELRINGAFESVIATHDAHGRKLPHWRASRVLRDGELFVYSAYIANSFDSRFFGPVNTRDVLGVYRPWSWQALFGIQNNREPKKGERKKPQPCDADGTSKMQGKIKGCATPPANGLTCMHFDVSQGDRCVTGFSQEARLPSLGGVTSLLHGGDRP